MARTKTNGLRSSDSKSDAISEPHLADLIAADLGNWGADQARRERLDIYFPDLRKRLDRVQRAFRIDDSIVAMATRHVISTEALVEILERESQHRAAKPQTLDCEKLLEEYAILVSRKVMSFEKRNEAEKTKIKEAYPEVNLTRISAACRHKLINSTEIAGVLEETLEYEILMQKLCTANLL
jgi:hypothetical protein